MIISSDGHATARIEDYTDYLDPAFPGTSSATSSSNTTKIRSDTFDDTRAASPARPIHRRGVGRADDPPGSDGREFESASARLKELAREGVVAEVLFPDFGLPFELYSPTLAAQLGYGARTQAQIDAGDRAYNRWLADFCSTAPDRFAGMASISFNDVEAAIREIHQIKDAGLRGVTMPMFDEKLPLYAEDFDPIWSTIAELASCSTRTSPSPRPRTAWVGTNAKPPHPACLSPLFRSVVVFYVQQIVDHLIWGGVLERHPDLRVVFTEQGSAWFASKMTEMDYSLQRELSPSRHPRGHQAQAFGVLPASVLDRLLAAVRAPRWGTGIRSVSTR